MYSNILAIVAGLSTLAAAAPSGFTKEPCAQLSQVYQQHKHDLYKHSNTTSSYHLPGELVHNCMQSIPFDSKRATAFVTELRKYLQFHSTTEALKNPPSGYLSPPVDLWKDLDHINRLAADNKYTNQAEFDEAIYNLFSSANDGHLSIKGMCSQQLFVYMTTMPVVSVSSDGLQLPEIYAAHDAELLGDSSHNVSPIVSVNGQDAVSFFKDQASKQTFQDPDAQYNSVFKTFARSGFSSSYVLGGMWQESVVWPGHSKYTFEFGNGTTRHAETKAVPSKSTKKIDFNFANGKALFNALCVPKKQSSSSVTPSSSATPSSSSSAPQSATPTPSSSSSLPVKAAPTELPKPVVREPENLISGYYLHEKGLEDVAVLLVPTFSVNPGPQYISFSTYAAKFIKQAVKDRKKRLVVDVTGNPGGTVNAGYDLFKQLFPNKPIYSAGRFRAHKAMDFVGQALATLKNESDLALISGLAVGAAVTPNQTYNFQSWAEEYGPYEQLGTNVSSLFAGNFSIVSTPKAPIHGYSDSKVKQVEPPFKPENILLVTDGYCASTCTIFSENMKWQGVKSLVFGGRPQNGPMQAIGGVKGAQAAELSTFKTFQEVFTVLQQGSIEDGDPIFSKKQIQQYKEVAPGVNTPPLPFNDIGVNLQNQYAPGDGVTPLQFVYEPADCRLFYTYENIKDPSTTWAKAARTYWGKGKCVNGSDKPSPSGKSSSSSALPFATPSSSVLL